MFEVYKKITIDGNDVQSISDALELARRYIVSKRQQDIRAPVLQHFAGVDEFDQERMAKIETAMREFWA